MIPRIVCAGLAAYWILLSPAPARAESFQYFRFTPAQLRDGGAANSVQLAEFEIYNGATRLSGAAASNPDVKGSVPQIDSLRAFGQKSSMARKLRIE